MAPYLIVFFLSLCIFYNVEHRNFSKGFLLLAILLPVFLGGFRHPSIGIDTMLYVTPNWDYAHFFDSFSGYLEASSLTETMYLLVNYVLSRISRNLAVLLSALQLIMIVPIVYVARHLNIKTHYVFIYYFFISFCETLNATRQSLAMSVCLLAFYFMYRGKMKSCLITMLVAYGFHNSAILFLGVLLLLYMIKIRPQLVGKKYFKFLLVVGAAIILLFFNQLMTFFTNYGLKEEYVSRYAESDQYGTNVPVSLFALTIFNLVIYYVTIHKKPKDKLIVFAEFMMLLQFIFCFAGLISTYAVRIGTYFGYVTMLLLPYCIQKYRKKWILFATTVFYIFYWYMTVAYANLGSTYPYKSIW